MAFRRRLLIIVGALLVGGAAVYATINLLPLNMLSVQQKPEQAPQKVHEYYIIIDEATGRNLMYVPLVVSIGDEVITEENKRYEVVRVEENRAYARFVEAVDLEKYKSRP